MHVFLHIYFNDCKKNSFTLQYLGSGPFDTVGGGGRERGGGIHFRETLAWKSRKNILALKISGSAWEEKIWPFITKEKNVLTVSKKEYPLTPPHPRISIGPPLNWMNCIRWDVSDSSKTSYSIFAKLLRISLYCYGYGEFLISYCAEYTWI